MKHPNALAAAGSSAFVATIIYLVSLAGVELPDPPLEVGIYIGGLVSAVFLFIGRNGVRGIARLVWRGNS